MSCSGLDAICAPLGLDQEVLQHSHGGNPVRERLDGGLAFRVLRTFLDCSAE